MENKLNEDYLTPDEEMEESIEPKESNVIDDDLEIDKSLLEEEELKIEENIEQEQEEKEIYKPIENSKKNDENVFEKAIENTTSKKEKNAPSIASILFLIILVSISTSLSLGNMYFSKMIQYVNLATKTVNIKIADPSNQVSFKDVDSLEDMIEAVMPTVVSITGELAIDYNVNGQYQTYISDASGSGVIVGFTESEILIATNYHVIQSLKSITVGFTNNVSVSKDVKVKAVDADYDIAIISIPTTSLDEETSKYIKIATISNKEANLGEKAIVIGNSLGYGISVTQGIVSAPSKNLNGKNYLQTDAAINEGNSGGPIFDMNGKVIAIANMKLAGETIEGMCFGIPTYEIYDLLMELMAFEPLAEEVQGYLGIQIINVDESNYYGMPTGLLVMDIVEGSAAYNSTLRKGDIIVKLNGEKVTSAQSLSSEIQNTLAGTPITLTIKRLIDGNYETLEVAIILGNRPIQNLEIEE